MSRATPWLAATAAIAAAWVGGRAYLAHESAARDASAGIAVPVGEASPPSPADRIPDPRVGALPSVKIPRHLPAFRLQNLAGRPVPITRFAGRALILNFWATWCGPCRQEVPLLQSIDREWHARRVTVVGVAVDRRAAVAAFVKRFRITYPVLQGERDALGVIASLGVASPAFPFTVFTDDRGEIVALYLGELHRPQIELILGTVQAVDAHRLALPAARHAIAAGLDRLRRAATNG
ncbi:MAG: TlpA family protein disulfide reductase [Gammaproteobacteria bacterium]|nr:TlpA family protein disulfide reductase [Gammaproteobacteria bacterium]